MRPLTAKTTTMGKNLCTFYGIRYQQSYFEQGIKTKKTSESHRICRQGVTKEKRVIKYKIKFMNMEERKKKKSIRLKEIKEDCHMCAHVFGIRAHIQGAYYPNRKVSVDEMVIGYHVG